MSLQTMKSVASTYNRILVIPSGLPMLVQEMRVRLRGTRPFIIMFIWGLILSLIAVGFLVFTDRVPEFGPSAGGIFGTGEGMLLLWVLSSVQMSMLNLLMPALSAGAISSEKEKGTFDLLAMTPMSSWSIVGQKLAALLAQAMMYIVASMPVLAIAFMLGGVSPLEVLGAIGLLLERAAMVASVGLFFSAHIATTRGAMFAVYGAVLLFSGWCGGSFMMSPFMRFSMASSGMGWIGWLIGGGMLIIQVGVMALALHLTARKLDRLRGKQ